MTTETATEPAFTLKNDEIRDEDLPAFRDLKFENINELHLDHPGASDEEYRTRRDYIASLAKNFRETGVITDVPYDEREQNIWKIVATKLEEIQARRASKFYLQAKKDLGISTDRIPQLSELNKRLKELSNFRLAPIEGLVETRGFLSWLAYRTMLSTQYIRHHSRPEYTPEPDIVHEAIGHIPMFSNRSFADFSQFIGKGAQIATDEQLEELGRLYWFTVEFGLIEEEGELKAYGAGLLSSFGELENAFTDNVERRKFDLEQVINTEYSYSDMQPVLYVIPSYEYLKDVTRKYIESFGKMPPERANPPHRLERPMPSYRPERSTPRYKGKVEMRDFSGDDQWLTENSERYQGKYVAIHGNRLIASGENLKEVAGKAREAGFPDSLLKYIEPFNTLPYVGGVW